MIGFLMNSWVARVIPIGLVLLAIQTTLLVELRPFGVSVQIVLAFAAATGAVGGVERGAVVGFTMGLMYDLAVGTPLGATAVTMALAGYVAGVGRLFRIESHWWILALQSAIGAAVGEAMVPVVRLVIGEAAVSGTGLVTVVVVVAVAAMVCSPVLAPLGRWSLSLQQTEMKLPPEIRSEV
ncbi:MAG: rod shape-determining protein MreD [Ilumatobacter sp.]